MLLVGTTPPVQQMPLPPWSSHLQQQRML
jgi:hypothetical protein